MKITIDISNHPKGISLYIDADGKEVLHVLADKSAPPDELATLIAETIKPLMP